MVLSAAQAHGGHAVPAKGCMHVAVCSWLCTPNTSPGMHFTHTQRLGTHAYICAHAHVHSAPIVHTAHASPAPAPLAQLQTPSPKTPSPNSGRDRRRPLWKWSLGTGRQNGMCCVAEQHGRRQLQQPVSIICTACRRRRPPAPPAHTCLHTYTATPIGIRGYTAKLRLIFSLCKCLPSLHHYLQRCPLAVHWPGGSQKDGAVTDD